MSEWYENFPPDVKVIETSEEGQCVIFRGVTYHRYPKSTHKGCNVYFRASHIKKGQERILHKAIYKAYVGEIPDGYHVHHKNGTDDNRVESLELLSEEEHNKLHALKNRKLKGYENLSDEEYYKVITKHYNDTHKEEHRLYREKNHEEILRKKREHYWKNRDRLVEQMRQNYAKRKEKNVACKSAEGGND